MKKSILNFIGIGLAVFSLNSCDLDINKDPYAVTDLEMSQLLTATEWEVGMTYGSGHYIQSHLSSYVQHTVSREVDNYALISSYPTLGNTWEQAYKYGVKNCDALIKEADESGNAIYAGIGRVLRAYTYLNLTDLWGDVPYSEANNPSYTEPKTDSSASIYNDLLKVLDKAVENFTDTEAENSEKPAADDLFYGGDTDLWIKAANTLKLKILLQARKAQSQINNYKAQLDALIADDNFLADGEDLQFPHSSVKSPSDERIALFVDEYEGGQKSVWANPWLYEIMKGYNLYNVKNNPMPGIEDPRLPYYFVNQSTATSDAENNSDYRDGGFVSIMMGSNSGNSSSSMDGTMTVIGIYAAGGKFDDGAGGKITPASGNGIAPDKMLQAYSVPFMKAELVLAGLLTGDASKYLEDGIKASITHVNSVSKASNSAVPAIDPTMFVASVKGLFDAASAEKKMEILMTQKWIANFFNSVEAYSDIRRTGYPVLFKGNEERIAISPYAQTVAADPVVTEFDLKVILDYPRVMWYPQDEIDVNPNITNNGRVVSAPALFWDVN